MDDIEFWYGNPSIEVYKGNLQMTSDFTGRFCMVDIPTSLILSDLCTFLQSYLPVIQELKILRTSSGKVYLCAISLQDESLSENFLKEFNNCKFNSIEDHLCSIVSICKWDLENSRLFSSFLDRCPICLEDIGKPAVSLLCGHLFHVKCLEMWSDTTCPVCRYHQTPPDTSVCDTCGEEVDVRMCLICGELGCGAHSTEHFKSTGHTFFQVVETSITWDYSREVSISRLITSSDKIVEVQDGKKIESIMFEYNCLLSSLLETQKEYYEQKIREIEKNAEDPLALQLDGLVLENSKLMKKIDEENKTTVEIDDLNKLIMEELERKKALVDENLMLNGKMEQRKVFRVTKEVLEEIKELEMQIKEMRFYVDTQEKLKDVDVQSFEIRKKK